MKTRCDWVSADNKMYVDYHDKEWGVPVYRDKKHFEFLILEGAQAGLSWETILRRRNGYKKAYANFEAKKVAKFGQKDFNKMIRDKGIIRNRLKIKSSFNNAKLFLQIQKEFGSFNKYIWGFVNNKPKINKFKKMSDLPIYSKEAEELSKDLKKRGFNFVGPTIIYAHMQATGLVNDHTTNCFRYKQIIKTYKK